MSYKILADTFAVARDTNHFVQIKTLKNPRTEDQIWVTFKIEGDTRYARSTMQTLIETLDEAFFEHLDMEVYERFEHALKEVNQTHKQLQEKRGLHALGKISAILAVFSGNQLHLTQSAEAEAYLVRKGKLSLISEGLTSRAPELFVNIASGELMPEDKLIFCTSRLLRLATHSQIAQMCSEGVVEALDSLREVALADTELSIGIACLSTKLPHRNTSSSFAQPQANAIWSWLKAQWSRTMGALESKMSGKKLPTDKSTILIIIGVLLLLLIVSATYLINSSHDSKLREEYKMRLESLNEDIKAASTKGFTDDKATANKMLDEVEKEAQQILETNYYRTEVLSLLDKVQSTKDSINNTVRVEPMPPYADLSAKRENVEALGLLSLKKDLFAYEYNALYQVIVDQVMEPKTVNDSEVILKGVSMKDEDVLTFLTQSGKIIEYSQDEFRSMNTADETWKSGVDLAAFGNFLYLLSPENNQIYKYTRQRNSYTASSEYSLNADLKDALAMTIDGSIYVLKKEGEIIKIFKGEQQDFDVEDMGIDISQATDIFTLPEQKNLYVFDPKNKRIVILEKDGDGKGATYEKQVYFEDLDAIQDFYVPEDEKKLYLLSKKYIYEVNL